MHFIFLTDIEKLYYICQKALAHIWKSFTTTVKKLKSNDFADESNKNDKIFIQNSVSFPQSKERIDSLYGQPFHGY